MHPLKPKLKPREPGTSSHVRAVHIKVLITGHNCGMYTIQHKTVLIIFPHILQTIMTTAQMLSIGQKQETQTNVQQQSQDIYARHGCYNGVYDTSYII